MTYNDPNSFLSDNRYHDFLTFPVSLLKMSSRCRAGGNRVMASGCVCFLLLELQLELRALEAQH